MSLEIINLENGVGGSPNNEWEGYIVKVAASPGVDLDAFQDGTYGPLILGASSNGI
jgi:hypothetical protein